VWGWALWLACAPPAPTPDPADCRLAPLPEGEVQARRIVCKEEILPGGEASPGDWLLENAQIRLAIRDASVSLTQLQGTGGTILDAALPTGTDALIEAIPEVGGSWFETAEVSAWEQDGAAGLLVRGTLPDGSTGEVGYALSSDAAVLELTGMDRLTIVPMTSSEVTGQAIETPTDGDWVLFSSDGAIEDLGGWVRWEAPSLLRIGDRRAVYQAQWPGGRFVQGQSDGTWIEVLDQDETVARFPVEDEHFSGWIPDTIDGVRAVADGAQDSPTRAARNGMELDVGAQGWISLFVSDADGEPLPATLVWNGVDYPWLPGDGALPVGAGLGSGQIQAGHGYDTVAIPEQIISDTVPLEVQLSRQVGDALLARTDVVGAPDPTERRSSDQILRNEAGAGVRYAILVAQDEIPRVSLTDRTAEWISAQAGSQSGGPYGAPMTWPWSTDTDAPAHGATPWHQLGPLDMLDVMTKAGSRRAVIDQGWSEDAGDPSLWGIEPEAYRIDHIDQLDAYVGLLQHWKPLTPVGPWTWIEDIRPEEASTTEAVRGIIAGRTTATTGPRLVLTVDGVGPGELLPASKLPAHRVTLRVEAASHRAPTHASLISDQGVIATWAFKGPGPVYLDTVVTIGPENWVLAATWSEDKPQVWAVSAPIWIGRP